MMQTADYSLLTRVFTRTVANDFANGYTNDIYNSAADNFIPSLEEKTNLEVVDGLYELLRKKYRNEYYYKNTLLNKLLLGVHSVNTTTALTELPIAKSKADFVLINGKAVVYEIKTELDNFDRLDEQVANYYKVFDHVAVVTCNSYCTSLLEKYKSSPVGVYEITKAGRISTKKMPSPYNENISYTDIFATLRKAEYENILLKFYSQLPDVSQFDYYDACLELFGKINIDQLYRAFLEELKTRNKINCTHFFNIPLSLKSLGYFCNFNPMQYIRLNTYLRQKFRR